ncbi:MAG: hypothetical protein OQK98_06645 [Gammaproteobacteria bacterium]|nr:hypothetical protein [Gammaproteobacteria bacterium]
MIQEMYDDIDDLDDDMEMEFFDAFDEDEDDEDDVDDMLEALMEEDDEDDLAERRRRRRKRGRRSRRKPVRTARGRSLYRGPTSKKYVTHPQLKSAMGRVGKDIRRNAIGIKSVNKRVASVGRRVDGVVSVNRVQSKNIGRLKQQMKLDGALDFAESLSANADGTLALNLLPMLKGAIKSGMLGSSKGAFSSPAVIGGLGFLLSNPQIFSGLLGAKS